MSEFDWKEVKNQFPSLQQEVHGKPLSYLDNAATSHKPTCVIEALEAHYQRDCSNIHRGVHELSQRATRAFEEARKKVQGFIGAASEREVIFTRGTTEAINLVAQSYGGANLGPGAEIVITGLEHHSNIVPWQLLGKTRGTSLRVVPVQDDGTIRLEDYQALLSDRVRLVSIIHTSNALGTINPAAEMIQMAHERGIPVLLDGAQAVPRQTVDVQALDCDFMAFSGHKIYGPTGIGVLYGKEALLNAMPPWQGGGDMIRSVSFEESTFADLPSKFEAGTPHIAGAIALGTAVDWMRGVGVDAIGEWEAQLLAYGTARLEEVPGLRIIGTGPNKAAVISFVMEGIHSHDIGTILDMEGVAVRTGHHCAEPLMRRFGVAATTRASFAAYNSMEDVDRLAEGLRKARRLLG